MRSFVFCFYDTIVWPGCQTAIRAGGEICLPAEAASEGVDREKYFWLILRNILILYLTIAPIYDIIRTIQIYVSIF